MANLITRKQFASLIGKTPDYVGTYIRRGKIIEKNKRIDTDNSTNKAFLAKHTTKEVVREFKKEQNRDQKRIESEADEILCSTSGSNEPELPFGKIHDIDYKLKEKDLQLKIVKIAKENLDLDKKKGKLIEIEPARDIMQRAIVVLSSQYRQESKPFITELAAKYNIPDADLAGIQKRFDVTINKAVNESRSLIEKECEIVTNEYSQTLNVGESKS